ncbi:hypothetical protein KIN20_011314 [Parelaphostrongylus tenuis]|uniref:SCP domain-containing protein n=1 Tax=Parelaphostrongylus tenuis TaxID=148309 RepID=A0AAD5M976_PARTN|nr:hypothetical protein KIN20_011314 [Parelaphostrongylus tenuis]
MNTHVAVLVLAVFIFAERFVFGNLVGSGELDIAESDPDSDDIYTDSPDDCGDKANMDGQIRFQALLQHNLKRTALVLGYVKNGKESAAQNFPQASDMSNLKYDCDLEYSAFDTALMCKSPKKYSFSDVGSNFATHPLTRPASLHNPATKQEIMKWFEDIDEIIEKWWSTATKSDRLVDYKPQEGNEPMIPFLQMANANTTKVGCAYNVCDNSDPPTSSPYVLFVCQYGDERIKIGSPIYKEGSKCSECTGKCVDYGTLCVRNI